MGPDQDITVLNSLIQTVNDSIRGYEESADDVKSDRIAELFREGARERREVLTQLQSAVTQMGGTPENDQSTLGQLHQTFLKVKEAITGNSDEAIVNEVERGEDYIKDKFETALNNADLTPQARQVIQQCYQTIQRGHDRARDLKHALAG